MLAFVKNLPFYSALTKYLWHLPIAIFSLFKYKNPSKDLIVIGVTGTKGKTTTSLIIYKLLKAHNVKTALISTAIIAIGGEERPNTLHMTMPGRGFIQKNLRKAVDKGDEVVIVETPSEGINQFRNFGVNYDVVIYTNLSPEHLLTHKTFDNYKNCKAKLFSAMNTAKQKTLKGKKIQKTAIFNLDDKHSSFFVSEIRNKSVEVMRFGTSDSSDVKFTITQDTGKGVIFKIKDEEYTMNKVGSFWVYNTIPSLLILKKYFDFDYDKTKEIIKNLEIAHRFEIIKSDKDFVTILDFAHEPLSVETASRAAQKLVKHGSKLILVSGAVGGGRWVYNAAEIGRVSTTYADKVIFTEEDIFEDDIEDIFNEIKKGVVGENYVCIKDRREALKEAINMAEKGDVVLATGKGNEVHLMRNNNVKIDWDEKKLLKELLEG